MADVIHVLYRLRDMAGKSADRLRGEIAVAQAVLDRLDAFANDAEDVGQLAAASDLAPTSSAYPPTRAGMVRIAPEGNVDFEHSDLGRVKGVVLSIADGGLLRVRLEEPTTKPAPGGVYYNPGAVIGVRMADAVLHHSEESILDPPVKLRDPAERADP